VKLISLAIHETNEGVPGSLHLPLQFEKNFSNVGQVVAKRTRVKYDFLCLK
jgi:hypothetical protein